MPFGSWLRGKTTRAHDHEGTGSPVYVDNLWLVPEGWCAMLTGSLSFRTDILAPGYDQLGDCNVHTAAVGDHADDHPWLYRPAGRSGLVWDSTGWLRPPRCLFVLFCCPRAAALNSSAALCGRSAVS